MTDRPQAPAAADPRPSGASKARLPDLACFGGAPAFAPPISTSNLVRPDWARFAEGVDVLYADDGGADALVERFEARAAAYHQVPHAVATSNGFWALALAMRALALPGRSEVVMPSLTYRRLADIAAWVGLTPHFCEVDPATLAIDVEAAAACVNERTALLLGVHPIVGVCDAPGLEALSARSGVPLLIDGVESTHETVGGRKVGSFGRAEVFSLHASKLVNGFEGGYLTTRDGALAARLRALRDRGRDDETVVPELGVDARMAALHAAMALAGFDDLPAQVERNRARYRLYQRLLAALPGVRLLAFDETEATSFKTIVVELLDDWPLARDLTVEVLNRDGVLARAYYAPPLHRKKVRYPVVPVSLPLTDRLAGRFMLLPCGHFVDEGAIARTVELLSYLARNAAAIQARLAEAAE